MNVNQMLAVRLSKKFVALVLFSESGLEIQPATSSKIDQTEQIKIGRYRTRQEYESEFSERPRMTSESLLHDILAAYR